MRSKSKRNIDSTPMRVGGTNQIRIPAESVLDIQATGPMCDDGMVVETLEYHIGGSITDVSVLVRLECGNYIDRVENRSPLDIWLKPCTVIRIVSEEDHVMEKLQFDVTQTEYVVVDRVTIHQPRNQVNSADSTSASDPSNQPDMDVWIKRLSAHSFQR